MCAQESVRAAKADRCRESTSEDRLAVLEIETGRRLSAHLMGGEENLSGRENLDAPKKKSMRRKMKSGRDNNWIHAQRNSQEKHLAGGRF
jgi:hypothetical protein